MKTIIVVYWHGLIAEIKYKHGQEFNYSTRRLNSIIKHVLDNKCSVMIRNHDAGIIIWIDKGRFGQK